MGRLLTALFGLFTSDVIVRLLLSVGVSLTVNTFISKSINDYINRSVNSFTATSDILALLNIARVDECISIIIGGLILVATYKTLKLTLIKSS